MNKKFVWIGAGSASNPKINFDNFDSIVLVDARKEACDELNEHFKDNAKITTKQVCISERNGESVFFQCNVEELSALAKPAQLKSLYPGLKVNSYDVDTVSITDFLKEEFVDGSIELFIDIPATSWILARELSKSKVLNNITKLHVSIGTDPALYEDSADLTELASLLKAKCFDEITRDYSDPDIPVVSFKLNENLKTVERLKAENGELQQQLIEARQHNDNVVNNANKLSLELDEKSELIEAKNIEIQALNTDIAKYKAELQKKSLDYDELCNRLDESKSSTLVIENKLSEEQEKVSKITKELDKKRELIKAKDIEIQAANTEIATYKVDYQKKSLECDELTKKLDSSQSSNQLLINELSEECSKVENLTRDFDEQVKKLKITEEACERLKESEHKISRELASKKIKLLELTESCDVQTIKLQATLDALEQSKKSELKKIEELKESQAHQAELRRELEITKDELKVALEEAACAKKAELNKSNELNECLTKLNGLQHKVNEVNAINLNLSKSIDVSAKQNLKLQTDLDDLRQQFSANRENEARLKSLISELYQKLSRAASFYHRLEKSNPELLGRDND